MSHFRFVRDWLEGWNSREPDRVMAHYAEDAVLQSPSVLAFGVRATALSEEGCRKLGVFADERGFTVEVFEFENDLVKRNTVYWSAEEVASRFGAIST